MLDTRYSVDDLNQCIEGNMSEALGIQFTELSSTHLTAKMPVDKRTVQPIGILNGGASAALAETVGSFASYLAIDRSVYFSVGLDIKCNHIRSVQSGWVFGKAIPEHIGRRTHVWQIRITDEKDKLVCLAILSTQILRLDEQPGAEHLLRNSPLSRFS